MPEINNGRSETLDTELNNQEYTVKSLVELRRLKEQGTIYENHASSVDDLIAKIENGIKDADNKFPIAPLIDSHVGTAVLELRKLEDNMTLAKADETNNAANDDNYGEKEEA